MNIHIDKVLQAIADEPEFPDDAPPQLMEYIRDCIEKKDEQAMLHMMRQTVRLTKECIAERIIKVSEAGNPVSVKT